MGATDTQVLKANDGKLSRHQLEAVVQIWKKGGLVAFPTETVYGLGANALDPKAVARIFAAKGRPSDNPLIVHVGDVSCMGYLVREFPGPARELAQRFWPGPLTIVLPTSAEVPAITRGGLDTVGIRIPDHPTALQLLKSCGLPIAAPSANTSGRPSPVTAQDVLEDLKGKIECVVDAGPTGIGLESTVVAVEADGIRVLRPGGVTVEELREVAPVQVDPGALAREPVTGPVRSPGMKYRHYAPQAPAVLVEGRSPENVARRVIELAVSFASQGACTGVMASEETAAQLQGLLQGEFDETLGRRIQIQTTGSRGNLAQIAANVYRCLREFDRLQVDTVVIEGVPLEGMGLAVANRLRKAAGYNVAEAD